AKVVLGPRYDESLLQDREAIKQCIQSRYHLVGYTDALELFLFVLHVTDGFPLVLFRNRLVRKERAMFQATAQEVAIIESYNRGDRILYNCVREQFHHKQEGIWSKERADEYQRYMEALRAFQHADEESI